MTVWSFVRAFVSFGHNAAVAARSGSQKSSRSRSSAAIPYGPHRKYVAAAVAVDLYINTYNILYTCLPSFAIFFSP